MSNQRNNRREPRIDHELEVELIREGSEAVVWARRVAGSAGGNPATAGEFMELVIVALIFGGIVEEICFRGFFIGWGVKLFGSRWALPLVLVISVVFGIGHWYQGPAGAIVTGVGSAIFGLVYVATGFRLLPAIATHMSSNFLGVLDLYLYGP